MCSCLSTNHLLLLTWCFKSSQQIIGGLELPLAWQTEKVEDNGMEAYQFRTPLRCSRIPFHVILSYIASQI